MYTHRIIKKIPGTQRGFNYVVSCLYCSLEYQIKGCHFNEGRRVFCSKRCRALAIPVKSEDKVRKGYFIKNGYKMVRVAEKDYRAEHRHVMEQHIGRCLEPHEVVHHINHDRQDNRIENLEITTKSHNSKEAIKWHGVRARDEKTGRFL